MGQRSNEEKYWERQREAYRQELKRDKWSREMAKKLKGKGNQFGPSGNLFGIFLGFATLGLYLTSISTYKLVKEDKKKSGKSTHREGTEYLAYDPSESDMIDVADTLNSDDKY